MSCFKWPMICFRFFFFLFNNKLKWVILITISASTLFSFANFLMFGFSRFGINKLWLGAFGISTIVFLVLGTLSSLSHSDFLRKKCLDFVGNETHPNFSTCFQGLDKAHKYSLFSLAGLVGFLLFRLVFRFKDWGKLLALSVKINSVYRKKLVFLVFFLGVVIKALIWTIFAVWFFFQISTGFNENVPTNEGFYTTEVRRTNLQWFNYSGFILGIAFFYISIRVFLLFGKLNSRKKSDYYHCVSMVFFPSQALAKKTSSKLPSHTLQKIRVIHLLGGHQW